MPSYKLSIIVPARNEEWLSLTIEDALQNTNEGTQVIVVADGAWPNAPGLRSHPRLTLIHNSPSIGQRAACNQAARIASSDYLCKLDAHCRVDKDFDLKLIADAQPDWIITPRLYNLHVFDWKCTRCGLRTYQGPTLTHCTACKQDTKHIRKIVWEPRWNRMTDFMRFDSELHFQYWRDFGKRPEGRPDLAPTMSMLGACWFLPRKLYWEIDGLDEGHGSWGQMGTELAAKIQTIGGQLISTKRTWFSHLFRTQSGFGFPYPLTHGQTERAREYSKKFWREGRWSKAVMPLSQLVTRFWPVPGWSEEALDELKATENGRRVQFAVAREIERNPKHVQSAPETGLTKGIVYYTENRCREPIFSAVQEQLKRVTNGHQIVSVSLKPIDFGDNYVLGLERGYETMFKQILMGLSQLDSDVAYLCEHDALYSAEHFAFTPPRDDTYFYDENVWRVSARTGQALFHYHRSVSMMCANRRLLIDHYRERLARIEKEGFSYRNGFEPGTKRISHGGYDNHAALSYFSAQPSIDIRDHGSNLTRTNWSKDQYRNPKYTAGWQESDRVPGWGVTLHRFDDFLRELGGHQ